MEKDPIPSEEEYVKRMTEAAQNQRERNRGLREKLSSIYLERKTSLESLLLLRKNFTFNLQALLDSLAPLGDNSGEKILSTEELVRVGNILQFLVIQEEESSVSISQLQREEEVRKTRTEQEKRFQLLKPRYEKEGAFASDTLGRLERMIQSPVLDPPQLRLVNILLEFLESFFSLYHLQSVLEARTKVLSRSKRIQDQWEVVREKWKVLEEAYLISTRDVKLHQQKKESLESSLRTLEELISSTIASIEKENEQVITLEEWSDVRLFLREGEEEKPLYIQEVVGERRQLYSSLKRALLEESLMNEGKGLVQKGNGVFTMGEIWKGQLITVFEGKESTEPSSTERKALGFPTVHLVMEEGREGWFRRGDEIPEDAQGLGSYIRDPVLEEVRGMPLQRERKKPNVKFLNLELVEGGFMIVAMALDKITPGKELLVYFPEENWRDYFTFIQRDQSATFIDLVSSEEEEEEEEPEVGKKRDAEEDLRRSDEDGKRGKFSACMGCGKLVEREEVISFCSKQCQDIFSE